MRVAFVAALACAAWLVGSPAQASSFTTVTQEFYANFATSGASEFSTINQYGGPLRLYAVTIDWSGSAYTSLDRGPYGDDTPYTVNYSAGVWYDIFGTDKLGNFVDFSDGTSGGGAADCTDVTCELSFTASGKDVYRDPSVIFGFLGDDYLTVATYSYIDPQLDDTYVGVSGTITYLLGPVPEPASWMMLVAGFGMAGAAVRRQQRATAQLA